MKTEFHDRSGKPLHIGDIVQYRLGSNDATLLEVVETKKGIRLVSPEYARVHPNHAHKGSIPVNKIYEKHISIVNTSAREL